MLIKDSTIEEVHDRMQITDVVSQFVALKKAGSNFIGLCPFHTEKTPSFNVTPSREIFKCFGCGMGGDAITFIIEHEHLTYPDAIKWLAEHYNITVEYEDDHRDKKEVDEEESMRLINRAAARKWHEALMNVISSKSPPSHPAAHELLNVRMISPDSIIKWQLGFAPDDYRFLTPIIIEKNLWAPAEKLGLVKNKNESNYDFFRNRIMIPILDHQGVIAGFSGRLLPGSKTNGDDAAKYINSKTILDDKGRETGLYKKSKILFGLWHAAKVIRQNKFAYIAEGNFDVIALHDRGLTNVVAPCGTALTLHQVQLLKKYCDHAVIITDPDAAGTNATLGNSSKPGWINQLLEQDFKVEYCTLPEGEDPDSFARSFSVTK